jgi:fermentation-respiration switch protein FrsA (DUF1100 family)
MRRSQNYFFRWCRRLRIGSCKPTNTGEDPSIGTGMSDDLFERAASKDKKLHVVEGSNHMKLYDVPKYVDEAVSVLAPFFKANL